MGISTDTLQNGLRSFPGLAHRMEQVGRRGNVLFVNDSKGTNADAAAHALSSFGDIFWIAGGKPKLGGITGLTEYFPRIRKAYLIGEAAQEFAGTLGERVPHEISETLDVAVANAARDAEASGLADPVVLLSPACASFDQYRNFEIRGDQVPRSGDGDAGREAGGVTMVRRMGRAQRNPSLRHRIDGFRFALPILHLRFEGVANGSSCSLTYLVRFAVAVLSATFAFHAVVACGCAGVRRRVSQRVDDFVEHRQIRDLCGERIRQRVARQERPSSIARSRPTCSRIVI